MPTRILRFCSLLALGLASTLSFAAAQSVQRDERGATISDDRMQTRVEFWREDLVRITHRPSRPMNPSASMSVIAKPESVQWRLAESEKFEDLSTARLTVSIDRQSGTVRIFNSSHDELVSEEPNGTWLSSADVGSAKETIASRQKFALDPDESIFGLGQHPEAGSMDLVGKSLKLLQENMHVSVPVMLSSKGYVLFWDNPAVTQVDVGKADPHSMEWQSEAGSGVDYYVALGPEPDHAIAGYRWLTGEAPLFPRWAWGFWQSRERYKTQAEILDIVSQYRQRHIPLDGIVQDWQYWAPLNQETAANGWGSHIFDTSRYPDPAGMIEALHDEHAHLMIVSWAKFDVTNSSVSIPNLRELEAVHGVYEPAIPYVYPPGRGKWYDPFNDKARQIYWSQLNRNLFKLGTDAWWLDASEPELSGRWGEFRDFKTAGGPGAVVFNAYPLEHTRTIYEGQRSASDRKRVFILTRSSYAGQQRNAAVTWSGDITSKWDVLQAQIPAGLNFVASGIPYWNTDIGGFFGNNPDDPAFVELFTRWFEYGAFTPMFRVHGTDKPKEIWRFDAATQATLINYDRLRYHLLPYIYSTSWHVTHDGYTMMRPLVMDFRQDKIARRSWDQFLFGPSLLINPVTQPGATLRSVYLPLNTEWIDFWTGKHFAGGQTITADAPVAKMPIYVRAGAIIPYGPIIDFADEEPNAPIELRIYPGANGDFTLYQDEGDSYDYEHGSYATVSLHWDDATSTLNIGARQGAFPGMIAKRTFRIVRVKPGHGADVEPTEKPDVEVHYTGRSITVHVNPQ